MVEAASVVAVDVGLTGVMGTATQLNFAAGKRL